MNSNKTAALIVGLLGVFILLGGVLCSVATMGVSLQDSFYDGIFESCREENGFFYDCATYSQNIQDTMVGMGVLGCMGSLFVGGLLAAVALFLGLRKPSQPAMAYQQPMNPNF